MKYQIRSVEQGDVWNIAHVVHRSRGLDGPLLERQVEQDVARFQEQGVIQQVESNTLVALDGDVFAGLLRYGQFEHELQLQRPDVDPAYDERDVTRALLREIWSFAGPAITKVTYVDHATHAGTLGDVFEEAGFYRWVDRLDMRLKLTEEVGPGQRALTFKAYSEEVRERFYNVYRASFGSTLDPMMQWSADYPEQSFLMFQERFGPFDPEIWVLATDAEGQDVGFAIFHQFDGGRYAGDTVLLYTGVSPQARGKGYGSEIVREGLRRVRAKRGPQHAVSLSVTRANKPAEDNYRKLGFRPTEAFTVYKLDKVEGRNS
ncbi:acetyltransferase (GNAT) family protein [Tumebacillus sp. BK434]|uniref:GNAT family N-acetyltransferase n=1 Tax=Tumebacillus sp. BK434 TaxID=2512169 RepID=UPI0010F41CD1|nr:GNAT family N-acetyltransferase [Tumebacillus sp. BK434]TCP59486.1 acetyltransferase (GNAT) family protein [Tumebacillus sp. BK434]